MTYQHRFINLDYLDLPLGKIVCVGRNYAEHVAELNNPVPEQPLLFMKPTSAVVPMAGPLHIPKNLGAVHCETELALLLDKPLKNANKSQAKAAVCGLGLAYDLTLRDIQSQLKKQGHPWERAKAFDASCPLSDFVPIAQIDNLEQQQFSLELNGQLQQAGNSADMLTPCYELLSHISQYFSLESGDVVLTGTPAGVTGLKSGDKLSAEIKDVLSVSSKVC